MKISVTGYEGTIGNKLLNYGCVPLVCDVTNPKEVKDVVSKEKPDIVIHCAAVTDVDYCESHFKESFDVNVRGTFNVVEAMPADALFIYLSSDHVFSGQNYFYEGYSERHKPSPVNRYGFSKWGGELATKTGNCKTIIVRSSKCFNYEWAKPTLDKLQNGEEVIFTDLIKRSFYHIDHLVDGLLYLANNHENFPDLEIINIAGDQRLSYYMFWVNLRRYLELPGQIKPRSFELKDKSPRPFRGGLDTGLAKRKGFPLHSTKEGFELIKRGI
jgi:dTDP-4-dehydrorhamnose reductase